jgi:hypothetical protein
MNQFWKSGDEYIIILPHKILQNYHFSIRIVKSFQNPGNGISEISPLVEHSHLQRPLRAFAPMYYRPWKLVYFISDKGRAKTIKISIQSRLDPLFKILKC